MINASHPNGHFYSPVTDPAELVAQEHRLWPAQPQVLGIDFNDESHEHVLKELFPKYFGSYDYPEHLEETPDLTDFYTKNSQFSWLDCRSLFVLLRHWQPKRMIEVGSGFSSLLVADVNRRFLDGSLEFTCVEPYPRAFLNDGLDGISRLIQSKVQDVPLSVFEELEAGDILFIDSSHVSKTGSDVNYLYFEVIPRLRPGVRIHIHDIFLPNEYLRDWVITENRSWNEQYLVRAFLMYNKDFRVLFGSAYAHHRFPHLVADALQLPGRQSYGGGSFWLERVS